MEGLLFNGERHLVPILALCALLSAVGCTQTIGRDLQYQPIPQPTQASNPTSPPVAVKVFDRRPTETIYSADNLNGKTEYVPQNNVWEVVESAFNTELQNRGFTDGKGGNTLTAILTFFWAKPGPDPHQTSFIQVQEVVASIGLKITVRRSDGSLIYSRSIEGQSKPWQEKNPVDADIWHRRPITEAAEAAIQDALARVFADPAFISALNTTQPSPQKAPAARSTSKIS